MVWTGTKAGIIGLTYKGVGVGPKASGTTSEMEVTRGEVDLEGKLCKKNQPVRHIKHNRRIIR